jgi:hypothetical protein
MVFAVFDPGMEPQEHTATDFTLNCPGVKRLGLHYRHFGTPLPLLKRLRRRFSPKNSAFSRRVEKEGLMPSVFPRFSEGFAHPTFGTTQGELR